MTSSINSVSTSQQDWAALMAQRMQAKMDTDKNGSISKSEFSAIMSTASASQSTSSTSGNDDLFNSMDANGDGSIDSSESESYLKKIQEEMLSLFNSTQASSQMPSPPPADDKGEDMFTKMDTDSSGSVSKSEFEAFMAKRGMSQEKADSIFAKVDTDGNGEISKSEHEAQMEKMKEQRQAKASTATTSSDFIQTLLDAIKANATNSNSDESSTTAINQLLSQLQSGIQYSQTGGISFGANMQSLFSLTA
jgi:Ca2+-binding EF-hand superfamily protein